MQKVSIKPGTAFYGGYLSSHPIDPWFLADVSYIPFTGLQSALALKLYSVLGLAALMLALWYVIAPLGPSAVTSILLLLLVVPEGFYGRLLPLGGPLCGVRCLQCSRSMP